MFLLIKFLLGFYSVELLDRCLTVEEFTLMNDDLMHFQVIYGNNFFITELGERFLLFFSELYILK